MSDGIPQASPAPAPDPAAPVALPILGAFALHLPPGAPLPAPPPGSRLRRLERMDRLCALALLAADPAFREAAASDEGLASAGPGDGGQATIGVVFGSAYGCHQNDEVYYRDLLAAGLPRAASPRLFVYTLPSSPAGEISIHFGLRGPALALVSGRHAGLQALGEARRALVRGRAALICACAADVATPLLARLEGEAPGDGAAVLILGRPGAPAPRGHLGPVAEAYCEGDPARALDRALRRLREAQAGAPPPERALCDEATLALLPAGALPCPQDACLPAGGGAAGALSAMATLATLASGPLRAALVLQTDPRGHAAAALWLR